MISFLVVWRTGRSWPRRRLWCGRPGNCCGKKSSVRSCRAWCWRDAAPTDRSWAGPYGGGTGGNLNTWGGWPKFDAELVWTLRNLGVGNRAMVRGRAAEQDKAAIELCNLQECVAAEVVEACAEVEGARARVSEAKKGVKESQLTFVGTFNGLGPVRGAGNQLQVVSRPQEAVAAISNSAGPTTSITSRSTATTRRSSNSTMPSVIHRGSWHQSGVPTRFSRSMSVTCRKRPRRPACRRTPRPPLDAIESTRGLVVLGPWKAAMQQPLNGQEHADLDFGRTAVPAVAKGIGIRGARSSHGFEYRFGHEADSTRKGLCPEPRCRDRKRRDRR